MFEKNLEAIRAKNPDLAARLEKIDVSQIENIQAVETESKNLSLIYNETNLHNPIDPIREAKTIWHRNIKSELKKNDIQVVYGLGLGYLFKRAYVETNSKIYIVEPFIDLLRFVLEHVDLSKELSEDRVYITDNNSNIIQKLRTEFLSGDKVEFLFLNSYAAIAQKQLIELTQKTLEICQLKCMDQNTILNQCKQWVLNSLANMKFFSESRPLSYLEHSFAGKTALILSVGPSLSDDINKIRENRDKYILIAVAPVLKYLISSGITPDFATFADSDFMQKHIEGIEDKLTDINLVIASRADKTIAEHQFKNKIIYLSDTDGVARWLSELSTDNLNLYRSGGTITILSYYLAKALGCSTIAFSGLDLAFINNKANVYGEEVVENTLNGTVYVGSFLYKTPVNVLGYKGQTLMSRDDYALFIRQFNEIFTEEEKTARIINTSLEGALINGMEYMNFENFVLSLNNDKTDVSAIVAGYFNDTKLKWDAQLAKISRDLEKQFNTCQSIRNNSEIIYNELLQINSLLENATETIGEVDSKLEAVKNKMIDTRNTVINNIFLSTYLQSEIWQYAQKYNTSILPSIDDVRANMQLEQEFFKSVLDASDALNTSMQELLQQIGVKSTVN